MLRPLFFALIAASTVVVAVPVAQRGQTGSPTGTRDPTTIKPNDGAGGGSTKPDRSTDSLKTEQARLQRGLGGRGGEVKKLSSVSVGGGGGGQGGGGGGWRQAIEDSSAQARRPPDDRPIALQEPEREGEPIDGLQAGVDGLKGNGGGRSRSIARADTLQGHDRRFQQGSHRLEPVEELVDGGRVSSECQG